jgi:hypothetical protein
MRVMLSGTCDAEKGLLLSWMKIVMLVSIAANSAVGKYTDFNLTHVDVRRRR